MKYSSTGKPERLRGFSLIEILLVVGLLAIVLIAAFLVYPRIRDEILVREVVSVIETAKNSARTLSGSRANYGWLTHSAGNSLLPPDWLYPNGGGNPLIGRLPSPHNEVLFFLAGSAPPGQPSTDPSQQSRMALHVYRLPTRGEGFCARFVSAMAPSFDYILTTRPAAGYSGVLLDRLGEAGPAVTSLNIPAAAAACQTTDLPLFLFVGR